MPKNKIFDFLLSSKNNNISNKGFTLAEVLIIIAIMLFLFSMVLTNYNTGDKQFSLYRSAHDLAQDLRNAQEMAMTGKTTPVQFGDDENFPAGGYGLYFENYKNSYILFADCDGDNKYDPSGGARRCEEATLDIPYPEKIQDLSLESGVIISSLNNSSFPLTIVFFPPIPVITINSNPYNHEAVIKLELGGKSKVVTINTAGLIDVD